jgi:hypothetical protein
LGNQINCIKIRHAATASDKLKVIHKMLGISNQLAVEIEAIYNRWSRVRIINSELKRLIQIAMVPNKEVYETLKQGREQELSRNFNIW